MRSIEFLIHYQCQGCGAGWASGDRFPLLYWECQECRAGHAEIEPVTAHPNLMTSEDQRGFAKLLRSWADTFETAALNNEKADHTEKAG